jgi:hypothetical protein
MAERIVSPGVFTRENDLSFLPQGIGEIGAAFIGPLKEGPAFVPTIVRTQAEFEEMFGKVDGTYYTEYAVQNYLREAGQATIVRVAGTGGYTQKNALGIIASGSAGLGEKIVGVLYSTEVGDESVGFANNPTIVSSLTTSGSFTVSGISGSGTNGNVSASVLATATNDLADVFGESAFGSKIGYSYLFFEDKAAYYTGSVLSSTVISGTTLPDQIYGEASQAETPIVVSQLISGQRYNLFQFKSIGHGTNYNTKFKIGISNVKAAGEDGATDYSTFTVTIRRYDDTDKRKVVLETFANVNLDPSSVNYIARRIGDRYYTVGDDGKITEYGDWANQSKYVRVVVMDDTSIGGPGTYPISAAPFGHAAYINPIKANNSNEAAKVPAVIFTTGSANNSASSPLYFSGFDFETSGISMDNKMYMKPIPNGAVAGANVDFAFDSQLTYVMTGSNSTDMAKRQFALGFQRGFDGIAPTTKINLGSDISVSNSQGLNLATSVSTGTLAYEKAINAISNADEFDINMVVTPGIIREYHPAVTTKVIDMVENRQDCFYIADFNKVDATIAEATAQSNAVDSNYVATYYPWVKTVDTNTNKLLAVPPSVLMPAVYAANDRLAAEWFAPAGLNRGGIVGAVSVLNRLTHAERDTLYENKVNPIAAFPGQGIVAFGQKTLQDKASALDRINVRRLLITLKKFVASTSRFLVFEQNTATTRARFLNTVNPYLEAVQQRQGLYAFRVVMDETNNTPDVIDRNILAGQIFLQPAKTAEFIVIDFNILPTGASFSA